MSPSWLLAEYSHPSGAAGSHDPLYDLQWRSWHEVGLAESEQPSRSTEKARVAPNAMIVLAGSLYSFTQTALLVGLHDAGG